MFIVRWLMGHPIIAVWVLGALAIFMTLGNGKKHESVEHEAVVTEHTDKNESSLSVAHKNEMSASGSADESVTSVSDEVSDDNAKEDVDDSKDVVANINTTEISSDGQAVLKNSETLDTEEANELSEADSDASEASENTLSEEQILALEPPKDSESAVDAEEVTAVSDLNTVSTEELLKMAREAYWNNGLEESALLYKQLITLEPKIIEHKGELGNVYWRQGYPKKAAELYLEIAEPMIKNGKSDRVANMIGFIGLFYPEKAANLSKQLQSK